jgi:uncharacterized protein YukE
MPDAFDLTTLGEYTNRGANSISSEAVITTKPEPDAKPSEPPPPPPAQSPPTESSPTTLEPDLIADLAKQFVKDIGEPPAAPPAELPPAKAPEPPPAEVPPASKEEDWKTAEPPKTFTKKAADDWRTYRSKAIADVESRDARIKALETEVTALKAEAPKHQTNLDELRKQLAEAQSIVERVAVERSPVFKSKILDQEGLLKARLGKLLEGTGVSQQDATVMLGGNLNAREQLLEARQISSFRKQQIADLLGKWDLLQEDRERMTSRGQETLKDFIKEQEAEQASRRAEWARQADKIFTDQMALCCPKLEPYVETPGNDGWNQQTRSLRVAARMIYDGNVSREQLAQIAFLAPAAVVFQKLLHIATGRISELQTQVDKFRGVSPQVRDTGGDIASPSTVARTSSPNGDFVKDLVAKFQQATGAQ